jgi:hypothetical protein|uniref:Uncharacterized protein n=1 Tax=Zea mays TaxID=4577 RepID=A0A804MG83_MAIZE
MWKMKSEELKTNLYVVMASLIPGSGDLTFCVRRRRHQQRTGHWRRPVEGATGPRVFVSAIWLYAVRCAAAKREETHEFGPSRVQFRNWATRGSCSLLYMINGPIS